MKPAEVDFKRNAAVLVATLSADKAVAFLTFVFFANFFSTEVFGVAYAVIAISSTALGFPRAVNVSVRKKLSEDTRRTGEIFVLGFMATVGYAAVVGAIAFATTAAFQIRHEQFVGAGVLHLFSRSFLHLVKSTHEGIGDTDLSGVVEMVDGIVTSVVRFVLVLGLGMNAGGIIYGPVVAALAVGIVSVVWVVGVPRSMPSADLAREFARFSFWTVLARGVYTVYNTAQVSLPGFIVGATATSFMKTAQTLAEPAGIVRSAVVKNNFVDVSSLTARGEAVRQTVRTSLKYADLMAFPLVGGALVVGEDVMTVVYGSDYAGTGIVLLAIMTAFLFNVHVNVLSNSLHAVGRPQLVVLSNALISVVFVPILVALLLVYDTIMVILPAIIIGRIIEAAMLYYLVHRATGTRVLHLRPIAKKLLATALMTGVVAAAGTRVDTSTTVGLAVAILLGGTVYFGVLATVDADFRQLALSYVGG